MLVETDYQMKIFVNFITSKHRKARHNKRKIRRKSVPSNAEYECSVLEIASPHQDGEDGFGIVMAISSWYACLAVRQPHKTARDNVLEGTQRANNLKGVLEMTNTLPHLLVTIIQ